MICSGWISVIDSVVTSCRNMDRSSSSSVSAQLLVLCEDELGHLIHQTSLPVHNELHHKTKEILDVYFISEFTTTDESSLKFNNNCLLQHDQIPQPQTLLEAPWPCLTGSINLTCLQLI
ncbi:hypothetical protein M758_3G000800 [Ceratodon purpureus]|uniref:Uncharacterized protein n=1 Tax=Ceratodon purpureus TaxID=3225 RepID=A0A8T0IFQ2_CERPU|nr:hypothetical protein KC19_3G003400 [Ceratodon purpureus]KAG0621188.1 hypothetical protein M758_3G000800 [Ceratodon purpureus]